MKIAVVVPEPVGARMSGIGIRLVSLARVMASRHSVSLGLVAIEPGFDPGLPLFTYRNETVGESVAAFDAVLVQGEPANYLLSQKRPPRVAVDLYDPFMAEALAYREEDHRYAHASTTVQLQKGDFFLCAHEGQKLFYLGILYALGRLDPAAYARDPGFDGLLVQVPFGVPDEPPALGPGPLRKRLGLPDDARMLFFGTFYDWYDTDLLQAVLERVLERPGVHFVAVEHLRAATTPQSRAAAFRTWAANKGWLGTRVHLTEWVPYAERLSAYAECAAAVSLYRPSIETALSFRTRLLDFLYAGLPVVAVRGGGLERVLPDQPGLHLLPPEPGALADALERLIDRPPAEAERRAYSDAVRAACSWTRAAAPLLAWLDAPAPGGAPSKPWWKRVFR
jgi:glycosyltransferase involved in cell wall biosynthesis